MPRIYSFLEQFTNAFIIGMMPLTSFLSRLFQRTTFMTLLIILLCVFGAVALMVILGERFGKPMEVEQQQKYSKILWIVVFIAIVGAIIREMI